MRASYTREETTDLYGIDKETTKGKNEDLAEEDILVLNVIRTGFVWNQVAA